MKTKKEILSDCFLGVIDFNEAAALGAMDEYAKQESAELLEALQKIRDSIGIPIDQKTLYELFEVASIAIKKATQ